MCEIVLAYYYREKEELIEKKVNIYIVLNIPERPTVCRFLKYRGQSQQYVKKKGYNVLYPYQSVCAVLLDSPDISPQYIGHIVYFLLVYIVYFLNLVFNIERGLTYHISRKRLHRLPLSSNMNHHAHILDILVTLPFQI